MIVKTSEMCDDVYVAFEPPDESGVKFTQMPERGGYASILLDDETTNHAFFDDKGYLFICQSRKGNRQVEVELHPTEAKKLYELFNRWFSQGGRNVRLG